MPAALEKLAKAALENYSRQRFRGGAVENLQRTPMGKGHGNHGKPFDLETACYMKPKFAEYDAAVANGTRLKIVDKSGVKTIKSFAMEICAADHICNRMGDAAIFFGSETAAGSTATTRILSFWKSIPRFADKMASIRSRFDDTNGALKFPDKTAFILSANLGNTAQKNLAFVGIQDCYVVGKSGMIKEAIARTTQYQDECIIWLESQGCEVGDDFEREYDDTDQRELHVVCPLCQSPHIFTWKVWDDGYMTRPDDFVPTPPRSIPSLDHQGWIEHNRPLLLAPERRVAGFKPGPLELVRNADGIYNETAVLRETYFECFHCGGHWKDDGEFGPIRVGLDQSSFYVPSRLNALPGNVGFNTPQWINRRLRWGKIQLDKLNAQKSMDVYQNSTDLQIWWKKVAARTWNEQIGREKITSVTISNSDPSKRIPNELFRSGTVDCQKDKQLSALKGEDMTGHFWVTAWATDKTGNDVQLWRAYCTSWDEWINKFKELGIPTMNISVDASFKPDEVKAMAARHAEVVCSKCKKLWKNNKRDCGCAGAGGIYSTWTMMRGSDNHSFRWDDGIAREYKIEKPEEVTLYGQAGGTKTISVNVITWSNFRFKNMLNAQLSQQAGAPKMTILPKDSPLLSERTKAMESSGTCTMAGVPDCSWDGQMNSEVIGEHPISKKAKFVEIHKQHHYRDDCCMHIVRKMQAGVAGRSEIMEQSAQKVDA